VGLRASAITSIRLSVVVFAAHIDSLTMRDLEESSLARLAIPDVLTPVQYYDGALGCDGNAPLTTPRHELASR
jgi:hypothetical protein